MAVRAGVWLNSREASERLGVKLTTLYAYASRGLITSLPGERPHARLYAKEDVERLRTRHVARSGHGPVAASALRFGEPVLETRISDVGPEGPRYRGQSAIELCRSGVSFERVAELLWTGSLPDAPGPAARLSYEPSRLWPLFSGRASLPKMALMLAGLALADRDRHAASDEAEFERARALFHCLAQATSVRAPRRPAASRVAGTLLAALRVPPKDHVVGAVDRALVLCAEHELNASAFAARVAASAGADLYACLGAAVNTLSGSAHGGMCDRVEALIASIGSQSRAASLMSRSASRTVNEWLARGETLPGFGHPLYPKGDPRATLLIELAEAHGPRSDRAKIAFALLDAMKRGGHPPPTLDAGLVALCACLELPPGSASSIFAVGRSAGWVAHALEQRSAGYLLRPRALYVGPK